METRTGLLHVNGMHKRTNMITLMMRNENVAFRKIHHFNDEPKRKIQCTANSIPLMKFCANLIG